MLREDRRLKLGGGKKYDARIDYLESSGTLYIDTGYIANSNTRIVMEFEYTELTTVVGLLGSRTGTLSNCFNFWAESEYCGLQYGSNMAYTDGRRYQSLGTSKFIVDCNKNTYTIGSYTTTHTASTFNTGYNLYLFAINTGGVVDSRMSKGRLYRCHIYDNGILVRDLIPVRVGTEACLYDKVTDTLLHNAGTGEFSLGGDVIPIEYLESNGNLYIDTRYYPNNNTKVDITYCATGINTYGVPLGCTSTAATDNANRGLYRIFGGVNRIGFGNGTGTMVNVTGYDTLNTEYNIVFDKNKMYINNNLVSTLPTSTWTSSYPLYLFTRNVANSSSFPLVGYIKYCRIYDDNLLTHNFISAVAGTTGYMYDIENDILYSNEGSGKFKLSPDSGYVEPDYVFSASNTSISHAYGGASTNVTVTSTADGASLGYYVSSKPSWVTTSISGSTLTITSSSNSNTSSRSGSVVLALNDSENTISISISQAGLPTELVTVTTNIACYITIAGTMSSSMVTSFTKNVAYGTNYTVKAARDGYSTWTNTYTAGLSTRSISATLNQLELIVWSKGYRNQLGTACVRFYHNGPAGVTIYGCKAELWVDYSLYGEDYNEYQNPNLTTVLNDGAYFTWDTNYACSFVNSIFVEIDVSEAVVVANPRFQSYELAKVVMSVNTITDFPTR